MFVGCEHQHTLNTLNLLLNIMILLFFSLRGLEVPEIVEEEPADSDNIPQYSPPVITELSRINAEVLPLFTPHGYR